MYIVRDLVKQYYTRKIGQHLQELGILLLVFIPLERGLTIKQILVVFTICTTIVIVGIEMERRTKDE